MAAMPHRHDRQAAAAPAGLTRLPAMGFLCRMPTDDPSPADADRPRHDRKPRVLPQTEAERAAREARLAAALRANLHRRKAQLRARAAATEGNDPDQDAADG